MIRARAAGGLAAVLVAAAALSACDGQPEASSDRSEPSASVPTPLESTPVADVVAEDFGDQKFSRSTVIDNVWSPLRPGMKLVYEGSAFDGKKRTPRRIVYVVTDLTKEIAGVETVVLWVTDFDDGELVEAELAFRAQDDDGNVWHLGEYPEEYEDGKLDKAPAWFHGIAGATAGIAMQAAPRLGSPDYAQGFAPKPINWADRARVHKVGQSLCVPAGCYTDVLVMEEFEESVPGASQLKFYASDVGLVYVGWMGPKEEEKEVMELVKATELSPAELAKVRDKALALEKRAYRISKDVYGRTAPSVVAEAS